MCGRFWFYRRRRVLPFAAVWCLVFVNGATLQPFVAPPELIVGAATAARSAPSSADSARRLQYERGDVEYPAPAVSAAVPPIVKNLRRPAPTRTMKAVARGREPQPADAPGPTPDFMQRVLAANAADLTRLCRLLL